MVTILVTFLSIKGNLLNCGGIVFVGIYEELDSRKMVGTYEGDSNPPQQQDRQILSLMWLPISPPRQSGCIILTPTIEGRH